MTLTIRFASWRWTRWSVAAGLLAALCALPLIANSTPTRTPWPTPTPDTALATPKTSPALDSLAAKHPDRRVEVVVQLQRGTAPVTGRELIRSAGGKVTRDLHIINAFGAKMTAREAASLVKEPPVRAVSINAKVEKSGMPDPATLATSFNASIRADKGWASGYTGKGVGVAVIDTGIQGNLPDFRVSDTDSTSRVIATAVVNPGASNADDTFGHGTHVAGLVAGNGANRPLGDSLRGKYAGTAPDANLIAVKVDDGHGNASLLDVIDGLQFAVDHKDTYNIKVANLSLRSTNAESYKTDPLDAAVEQAWFSGIAVVAAAGNDGAAPDAASYAPANDPYVISVGAVDDMGTQTTGDDKLASWSSRGTTQDGFQKPEVVAPGAHLVSTIPPGADYTTLCPTCVTDGAYFRVGGTSMAAGVVSGEVAQLVQKYPDWNPNQLKQAVIDRTRPVVEAYTTQVPGTLVDAKGKPVLTGTTSTTISNGEGAVDKALSLSSGTAANSSLTPSSLIDPTTGLIDYTRASWSRASWSEAVDPLRASWSRASWSRASWSRASWSATLESCSDLERASWSRASWSDAEIQAAQDACTAIDPTRASWSRASWSRASWSTSFDK
jgi:serine protease AprX